MDGQIIASVVAVVWHTLIFKDVNLVRYTH